MGLSAEALSRSCVVHGHLPSHSPPSPRQLSSHSSLAIDPFTAPSKVPAVPSRGRSSDREKYHAKQRASGDGPGSMHQGQQPHDPLPANHWSAQPHSPSMSPLSRYFAPLRHSSPALSIATPSPGAVPTFAQVSKTIVSASDPTPSLSATAMKSLPSHRHPASSLNSFIATMNPGESQAHGQAQASMQRNMQPLQPMSAPFAAPPGHRGSPPVRAALAGSSQARPDLDPDHRLVAFPTPGLVPRAPKLSLNMPQSTETTNSGPASDECTYFPSPPTTQPSGPYPGIPCNPPTPMQKPMSCAAPPRPSGNQDDLNETQLLLVQDAAPRLPQVPVDAPHYTACLTYERTLAHAAANNLHNDKLSLHPVSAVMTVLSKRKVPVTDIVWDAPERTYGAAVGKRFACKVQVLGKTYATRAKYLNKERAKRDAAWLVLMALWCTSDEQWREATRWVTGMDLHKAAESGKMMSLADYYRVVTRDNPLAKVPGSAGVPIISDTIEGLSASDAQSLVGGAGAGRSQSAESSPMVCPLTAPMTPAVLCRKTPKSRVLELGSKIESLNPVWGEWSRASNGEWRIELVLGTSGLSAIGSGSKRKEAEDASALVCLRSVLEHPQWGPKLKTDPAIMGKCFAGLEASASMSIGDGTAELVQAHGSRSASQTMPQLQQQEQLFPLQNPLRALPTSSILGAADAHSLLYSDDSSDWPIPTLLPDDLEYKPGKEGAVMTPLLLGQPGVGQPNIWSANPSSISPDHALVNASPLFRPDQQPATLFTNPCASNLHHSLPAVAHQSNLNTVRDSIQKSTSPSVDLFHHSAPARSSACPAAATASDLSQSAWIARMQLEDTCAKFGFSITFTISCADPLSSTSSHASPSTAVAGIHTLRELPVHGVQWTVRVHVQLSHDVALDVAESGANRLAVMEVAAKEASRRIEIWYGALQIAKNP